MLIIGPPGAGQTMLARRLPTILSDMSLEEAIETMNIHSVSDLLDPHTSPITTRPLHSHLYTISDAGLIGGGQIPKPGEVSQFVTEENAMMRMCNFCLERVMKNKKPIRVDVRPVRAGDADPLDELREKYSDVKETDGCK